MRAVGSQGEMRDLALALLAHVDYQRLLGAAGVPAAAPTTPNIPVAGRHVTAASPPADDAGAETLGDLRDHIGDCRRCKLAPGRRHLVFGVGNPKAQLVFVGEAPGADEDAKGEPFVGRAGQLLTEIITKGMRLAR
jgi:DNA polymerase